MPKKNFKGIGSSILGDVLGNSAPVGQKYANAELHKIGDTQLQSSGSAKASTDDTRLHVYISQELENLLLEEVYRRKRDNRLPKSQASKRAVVEDALGCYLYRIKRSKS